jgi:hypothetical protein
VSLCRKECREVKHQSSLENESDSEAAGDDAALKFYKDAKAQLRGGISESRVAYFQRPRRWVFLRVWT